MSYVIQGKTAKWEIVIGLEVHAQISSATKLFSRSSTTFAAEPNTQVSFVDAAMPGQLPVINEFVVTQAIKTGLALKATINRTSQFDRKNYFYADLPQGYQITQFYHPIIENGTLLIEVENALPRVIPINRVHIEQDAGKSIHDMSPNKSYIDLNRSGIALMEIVSEPVLNSPEEAVAYFKKLRSQLRYIGTCDGDLEKGSMRCDANVSVRPLGVQVLGTRCEIKNLNSLKFLSQAIIYEANRQVALIESGGTVLQETCQYDPVKGVTKPMRLKENAHDYRYFPCPDLPPLIITEELIQKINAEMPEMQDEKKKRYQEKFGLSSYDAHLLSEDKAISLYFEEASALHDPKIVAHFITGELFSLLNKENCTIEESKISSKEFSLLMDALGQGKISGKMAKMLCEKMWYTQKSVTDLMSDENMVQESNPVVIEALVTEICDAHPTQMAAYKAGKEKLFGFFVGEIMKQSKGKMNPQVVNEILKKKLQS